MLADKVLPGSLKNLKFEGCMGCVRFEYLKYPLEMIEGTFFLFFSVYC